MKSSKVLALIIGAIALFPSASFAGNVAGNEQVINLNSTTVGNGNVSVTEVNQEILNLQNSKKHGENVAGTSQKVNADTTTVGSGNVNIQTAIQKAINLQQAK